MTSTVSVVMMIGRNRSSAASISASRSGRVRVRSVTNSRYRIEFLVLRPSRITMPSTVITSRFTPKKFSVQIAPTTAMGIGSCR